MIESFLNIVTIGLVVVALLAMYRALVGPSAIDRVIAINIITTEIVMLILIYAFLGDTVHYIDVALVFVLGTFIATLCILKLLREGKLI
ncbi:MAG: monovalent cation/H+ antiporter complex subunit F [Bacillota bacterium]